MAAFRGDARLPCEGRRGALAAVCAFVFCRPPPLLGSLAFPVSAAAVGAASPMAVTAPEGERLLLLRWWLVLDAAAAAAAVRALATGGAVAVSLSSLTPSCPRVSSAVALRFVSCRCCFLLLLRSLSRFSLAGLG